MPAVVDAGDILLFDSRLWHCAGTNSTSVQRNALKMLFTRPWYRPVFDDTRSVSPTIVAVLGERGRRLLGPRHGAVDQCRGPPARRGGVICVYVLPFWSYRLADEVAITHHNTGQTLEAPPLLLDVLARLHAGTDVGEDARWVALAESARLIFADKAAADAWMVARGDRTPRTLPLIDQIEMTNRCPYTCQMCPRTTEMDRPLGDMDLDLLGSVLGQVSGRLDFVALHHFGESLLHRQLPEAVRLARSLGVRTGISRNPPSMRPAIGRALLDAGIANVLFSLDSLDAGGYRSIRGPAARIELADRNLREFIRARDAGDHDTAVTLQMISMRANEEEADDFLAYCAEVGVDRGVVIRLGRWDFPDEHMAAIGEVDAPGHTAPCTLPWNPVAVMWDGRVVPCCHDYDGAVVLGDLRTASLDQIGDSPRAREFRDHADDSRLCTGCAASKHYREQQRGREGFLDFHRERRGAGEVSKEWVNPASAGWRDGRRWFDRYDVLPALER